MAIGFICPGFLYVSHGKKRSINEKEIIRPIMWQKLCLHVAFFCSRRNPKKNMQKQTFEQLKLNLCQNALAQLYTWDSILLSQLFACKCCSLVFFTYISFSWKTLSRRHSIYAAATHKIQMKMHVNIFNNFIFRTFFRRKNFQFINRIDHLCSNMKMRFSIEQHEQQQQDLDQEQLLMEDGTVSKIRQYIP